MFDSLNPCQLEAGGAELLIKMTSKHLHGPRRKIPVDPCRAASAIVPEGFFYNLVRFCSAQVLAIPRGARTPHPSSDHGHGRGAKIQRVSRLGATNLLSLYGRFVAIVVDLLPSHAFASAASHVSKQTSTPRGPAGAREANDNRPRRRTARETARRSPAGAAGRRAQTPQRSAGVCTGASHSASVAGSAALTVIEQPAISSEVT